MNRRFVIASGSLAAATGATAALGRWFPSPPPGPLWALVMTGLGVLLIALAPSRPAAEVATTAPAPEEPITEVDVPIFNGLLAPRHLDATPTSPGPEAV